MCGRFRWVRLRGGFQVGSGGSSIPEQPGEKERGGKRGCNKGGISEEV